MQLVQIFISLTAVIIVVFGWRVIYQNARRLSNRSEAYSLLVRAINFIDELEKVALAHWVSTDEMTGAEIQCFLARINALRYHFDLVGRYIDTCWSAKLIASLRSSMSLDIESKHSFAEASRNRKQRAILSECGSARKEALERFIDQYVK